MFTSVFSLNDNGLKFLVRNICVIYMIKIELVSDLKCSAIVPPFGSYWRRVMPELLWGKRILQVFLYKGGFLVLCIIQQRSSLLMNFLFPILRVLYIQAKVEQFDYLLDYPGVPI